MEPKGRLARFAVLGAGFTFNVAAEMNNEINLGIMDTQDRDDQFIGVEYKRYLTPIESSKSPYLIRPYIQRANDVSVRYFQADNDSRYQVGANWYVNPSWVVSGDYTFVNRENDRSFYSDNHYQALDLNLGYFFQPNWHAGVGVYYTRRTWESAFGDITESYRDSDWSPSVFSRYTSLDGGSGWDVRGEYTFSDTQNFELDGRYFFNQKLSLSATYTYIEQDERFAPVDDIIAGQHLLELGFDYWFSSHFNFRFGLGTDLEQGDGISSLTLLTSIRF
ncbi:putative porin [Alteromonas aestuariivivens]|nr:putative porin [Alteromonas aestuariivivens]